MRWIGLTGVISLVLSRWLDGLLAMFGFMLFEPLAYLLFWIFALLYWRRHRDAVSVTLLVFVSVEAVLQLLEYASLFGFVI